MIPNNLYTNEVLTNLSKLSSYKVAERKCTNPVQDTSSKDFWDLFKDPKQKGGAPRNSEGTSSLWEPIQKLAQKLKRG
jgi:hypothetical protein